ncbi:hypothetical protein ABMC88_13100 [Sulfitobacter sp. HNIBRBA2951]|uniref:hypothetical protein n=1 Tax=Sulfitobacter aquimarinus TaxID=3158557 RepID=UPI0032DEEFF8
MPEAIDALVKEASSYGVNLNGTSCGKPLKKLIEHTQASRRAAQSLIAMIKGQFQRHNSDLPNLWNLSGGVPKSIHSQES